MSLVLAAQDQTVRLNSKLPSHWSRGLAMELAVWFSITRTRSKPKISSQPPITVVKCVTEAGSPSSQAARTAAKQQGHQPGHGPT